MARPKLSRSLSTAFAMRSKEKPDTRDLRLGCRHAAESPMHRPCPIGAILQVQPSVLLCESTSSAVLDCCHCPIGLTPSIDSWVIFELAVTILLSLSSFFFIESYWHRASSFPFSCIRHCITAVSPTPPASS